MRRLGSAALLVVLASFLALYQPPGVGQAGAPGCVITVDSALDNTVPDTVVTLREAILFSMDVANPAAGEVDEVTGSAPDCTPADPGANVDDIFFDPAVFPPAAPVTITLTSALPPLNQNGGSVSGSAAGVIVNGLANAFNCFTVNSNFHTISALQVTNCMIGVLIDGTSGPATNVYVMSSTIRGNATGAEIRGANATNNHIESNLIGTNVDGTAAAPNDIGVRITEDAHGNTVGGTASQRNIISGNETTGVLLVDGSQDNVVSGNYIGPDVNGNTPLVNTWGVFIQGSSGNRIGTPTGRNVISGNLLNGVELSGTGATGNTIQNNYIGTDATGKGDMGNGFAGILLYDAPNNIIGGSGPGQGNLLSGNSSGIEMNSADTVGNQVLGNKIGPGSNGGQMGNSSSGIHVAGTGPNTIGGLGQGEGNEIAYNGERGIGILANLPSSHSKAIMGNSIHDNNGLGIDLEDDGVTENDADDSDDGGNALQNFPELTVAQKVSGDLHVEGSFVSAPNTVFHIELFANDACDPSGNGEGQRFLDSFSETSSGTGLVTVNETISANVVIGDKITATAMDPDDNTSEFSDCIAVTGGATPTPAPSELLWGDNDCSDGIDGIDALALLYLQADLDPLSVSSAECPVIGGLYTFDGQFLEWGDVLCYGLITPEDVLGILAYLARVPQPSPQDADCPAIGSTVTLN